MRLLKSRFFRLIVSVVSLVLIVVLSRSILSLWEKRDVVGERASELSRVKKENEELKKQLTLANSPEFIERQAREKLGLAKPGEAIVLLPQGSGSGELEGASTQPLTNWQQWLKLFF